MGWANLDISAEIYKIKKSASIIEKKDQNISDALNNIISALNKIEEAMDKVAYRAHGN